MVGWNTNIFHSCSTSDHCSAHGFSMVVIFLIVALYLLFWNLFLCRLLCAASISLMSNLHLLSSNTPSCFIWPFPVESAPRQKVIVILKLVHLLLFGKNNSSMFPIDQYLQTFILPSSMVVCGRKSCIQYQLLYHD